MEKGTKQLPRAAFNIKLPNEPISKFPDFPANSGDLSLSAPHLTESSLVTRHCPLAPVLQRTRTKEGNSEMETEAKQLWVRKGSYPAHHTPTRQIHPHNLFVSSIKQIVHASPPPPAEAIPSWPVTLAVAPGRTQIGPSRAFSG